MKKLILLLCISVETSSWAFSQVLLNGDFENTTAMGDLINLTNTDFNASMSNCFAFGSNGNIDIISSTAYCAIGPQNGTWYVALTGGSTDILSMALDQDLTEGEPYTLSFYDRFCDVTGSYINHSFIFGLSDVQDNFGTLIYHATLPVENAWTEKSFTFLAPLPGSWLTIAVDSGTSLDTWEMIDHLTLSEGTGINEAINNEFNILVYPNPTDGIISFLNKARYGEYRIYSSLGALLYNQKINGGLEIISLDLSSCAGGIYVLELVDDKGHAIIRKKISRLN